MVRRRPGGGRQVAEAELMVAVPPDRMRHMVQDVPSWALWDPGLVKVDLLEGDPGQPGMLCRLTAGIRPAPLAIVQMLVATSGETTVFAGGGRGWWFIEVVDVSALGPSATLVRRSMEIHSRGLLRWTAPLLRLLVARHLRRSLTSLT